MIPGAIRRVSLVTGAARGIGRGIALRLAADGHDVALADLPGSPLPGVAQEIQSLGRRTHVVYSDVSNENQVKGMVNSVVDELGGLDIMVANAGIFIHRNILQTSLEDFEKTMSVNLRGVFLCYKYAGARMVQQGRGGRIIGAASVVSKLGDKGGVRSMTQAAAMDLARYGITVNAYAPGIIDTAMCLCTPVGRIGTPEDIAHLVSYMASEKSGFMTGQTVSCNGGTWCD
ncbi:hypothetical protein K488DRAFT_80283 [Vararia minispora EC-137]|uniref:Uncharacterized protein n=1 Tax=Vararia minispora EC-137 TaxID=1314806 RepID=A0ACB8QC93_9AGAM|nr:hypothetical protein K488DRAFT_80283 [Vararia minispora EC-137]